MRTAFTLSSVLPLAAVLLTASPAAAQRFPFEKAFDMPAPGVLDVVTERGAIEIVAGRTDRILVHGTVTVRVGAANPLNAPDVARAVAASPPVQRAGATLRLRPPMTDAEKRAVTVSYRVEVPPGIALSTRTDSGATTITGVTGAVSVTTDSAAIHLAQLGGTVIVATGSGAVDAGQIKGSLVVTTKSSAFKGTGLGGGLTLQTSSGAVDAAFTGNGLVSVQTGSSGMRLANVRGALRASSRSGRFIVSGTPGAAWELVNGSGNVELTLQGEGGLNVDLVSHSATIALRGVAVDGTVQKLRVVGKVRGGGPLIRVETRSGSIVLRNATAR
jgi:hypothetical protein